MVFNVVHFAHNIIPPNDRFRFPSACKNCENDTEIRNRDGREKGRAAHKNLQRRVSFHIVFLVQRVLRRAADGRERERRATSGGWATDRILLVVGVLSFRGKLFPSNSMQFKFLIAAVPRLPVLGPGKVSPAAARKTLSAGPPRRAERSSAVTDFITVAANARKCSSHVSATVSLARATHSRFAFAPSRRSTTRSVVNIAPPKLFESN